MNTAADIYYTPADVMQMPARPTWKASSTRTAFSSRT